MIKSCFCFSSPCVSLFAPSSSLVAVPVLCFHCLSHAQSVPITHFITSLPLWIFFISVIPGNHFTSAAKEFPLVFPSSIYPWSNFSHTLSRTLVVRLDDTRKNRLWNIWAVLTGTSEFIWWIESYKSYKCFNFNKVFSRFGKVWISV